MKKLLLLFLSALPSSAIFSATTKQELVRTIKDIDAPLWQQTVAAPSSDPALLLSPTLATLPGLPATSTLFFSRTPVVTRVNELFNSKALQHMMRSSIETTGDNLATLQNHLNNITVQEHTIGMQLGQQWQQESWELSWHWWLGVRERNMWLSKKDRKELRDLVKDSPAQVLDFSAWRASTIKPGVGDVHITGRYRAALGSLFNFSLGFHTLLPTATKQKAAGEQLAVPLENDTFTHALAQQARDIMLCSTFGTGGSTGIGLSAAAQLNLTDKLKVVGEITSLRFRPHAHQRYALKSGNEVPFLLEGDTDTQAGMSTDSDITAYIEHYLYPRQEKIQLTTGALHVGSVHVSYSSDTVHHALGYRQELHEAEQSDSSLGAALRTAPSTQHQLTFTSSLSKEHEWGSAASYLTAHYTITGAHQGSWSIGFGATVQA